MGILDGKSVIVTGGAGGFGLSSAMLFARDGAGVTLMGRSEDSLVAARAALQAAHPGANIAISVGDALRDEDVRSTVSTAIEHHGRLDIVVSTVGGGGGGGPIATLTADGFMETIAYNVRSAFLAVRESIAFMPDGGSFVFISSTAAVIPFTDLSAYCAGKAALDQFVRAAANELGPKGFRFNSVRPGLTRTPPVEGGIMNNQALVDQFLTRIPLGRVGVADDISQTVRHLAGPESAWTTGQSIACDGGNELRGAPAMDYANRKG